MKSDRINSLGKLPTVACYDEGQTKKKNERTKTDEYVKA